MTDHSITLSTSPARWPYLAGGYLMFALGGLGIFLPLLPTTVFWIGAAWCFAKSSPEMYARLINWPRIGPIIHDFMAHGVISVGAKRAALIGMGLCGALVAALTFGTWIMAFSLGGIGIAASIVLSRPSNRTHESSLFSSEGNSCPFLAAVHQPFPISRGFISG